MQIGNKVKCISSSSTNYGCIGTITNIVGDKVFVKYPSGEEGSGASKYYQLISDGIINKAVSKIMGIKETFLRGLMSEPQKTFRKAGITNGDNLLTSEGTEVFLNWLFQKNSDAFKTEVADPIVEEQKEEKK